MKFWDLTLSCCGWFGIVVVLVASSSLVYSRMRDFAERNRPWKR